MKPIFVNKGLALISDKSQIIVKAISDNYEQLINSMDKGARTKKQYIRTVAPFLAFIQSNGINNQSFEAFKVELSGVEITPSTKNGYLAASKALLKQAHKYGLLPVDITANVSQFKTAKGHIKDGLKVGEVNKALEQIRQIKRESTRVKTLAMFYLFANEGLRQMEVANLMLNDLVLADNQINIKGKGKDGKESHLITDATKEALTKWLNVSGLKSGYLFPSPKNQGEPITERAIRKMFTHPKYGIFSKAGIDNRSVHGFRHFNVTETLNAFNGDLHRVMKRARIKAVQTVQSYDDRRTSKQDVRKIESHLEEIIKQ